jgi:hypothetical protein
MFGVEITDQNQAELYDAYRSGQSIGDAFWFAECMYDKKERLALIDRRVAGGMSFHPSSHSLR